MRLDCRNLTLKPDNTKVKGTIGINSTSYWLRLGQVSSLYHFSLLRFCFNQKLTKLFTDGHPQSIDWYGLRNPAKNLKYTKCIGHHLYSALKIYTILILLSSAIN